MRRREVLAACGALTSPIVGCLEGEDPSNGSGTPTSDRESATPGAEVSIPVPAGDCGTATTPQSDQFVDVGGGEPACSEGAMASLSIENERDEETGVEVDIASGGESVFAESYTLTPGERIVERGTLPAHGEHAASVAVDGREPSSGGWGGTSCYRHGISITAGGADFGLVPPLSGPGDTQHDCYSGDRVDVMVRNSGEPRAVNLYVVDHCDERVHEETLTIGSNEVERVRDVLANGGIYGVIVDVDGGDATAYEYYNECWGVAAGVDDEGEVDVHQMFID